MQIRALESTDSDAVSRFFARLSERSRYLRFFSPMPALPRRTLEWMVGADQHRHGAIGAWDGDDLIAEARYVAVDDNGAEVALTVVDEHQRQGVGSRMLAALAVAAAGNGFCRLTASTLLENEGIRRLLTRAGFVRVGIEAGTAEWERDACPTAP